MPLILSNPTPSSGGAATLDVVLAVQGQPGSVLTVVLAVEARVPAQLDVSLEVAAPLPLPLTENPGLRHRATFSGLPGEVIRYTVTGAQQDELSVTISGVHPLAAPSVTVDLESTLTEEGQTTVLGRVSGRLYDTLGAEPEVDEAARTTTLVYRRGNELTLRGLRLPEFVPWKLTPDPDPCRTQPQTLGVSTTVRRAMEQVGHFVLEDDPLADAAWVDGVADYTTKNLTPDAVWSATYGALGMELWWEPHGGGVRLTGRWPFPIQPVSGTTLPARLETRRSVRRQFLQTPVGLILRGRDHVTRLPNSALLELGQDLPGNEESERELQPGGEWFEVPESSGTARVSRGYRRFGGQVVAQIEVTTDDVWVEETVNGELRRRLFSGVLTGMKTTDTVYDTLCANRPLLQRTRTLAWAYHLTTQTSLYATPGPGLFLLLSAGDLVADEETRVTYTYSTQGYLSAQTTQTRRVASVNQVDAEKAPPQRGAVSGRETVTTTRTERWTPTGGGRWWYEPGVQGQTLMPLYDKKTGEAVRTVSVARATPDAPRLIEQAPPRYECAVSLTDETPTGECPRELRDPTGAEFRAGDVGRAEPREVSLPFVDSGSLSTVGKRMLAAQWPRVVTTVTLPWVYPLPVGSATADGRVQRVEITGEGQDVTSTVVFAQLDTSLMSPSQIGVYGLDADADGGTAMVLRRSGLGVIARVVTGWDVGAGQPRTERAYIEVPGGNVSPGDEVTWHLERGRRVATRVR
ncbi:hypothetical protein [Deinococcus rufus]|uniref:Uncharacterized protein n=1 Tax=Deinococcus rufus TaxID=2136097 RepID=A0ABV7ZBP2_9DEIO